MSKIVQPCQGVSVFRNPANDFLVMCVHYTADAQKRGAWAADKKRAYFDPQDFEYEHEIDFWSLGARATYWGFGKWNIVPAAPVAPDSKIYLSFDFGQVNATAVYFYAQHPKTKDIAIFDEVYINDKTSPILGVKNNPGDVSRLIYERMGERLGIDPYTMKMDDVVLCAVGDPAGSAYAASYAEKPWPISIMTKGFKLPFRLNDRRMGESKVNEVLRPSAIHCGARWFASECGKCKTALQPRPILTVMEGRAPNLVRTWPLIKKPKVEDGQEAGDVDAPKQEDHGPDSVRYLMTWLYFEMPESERAPTSVENMPNEQLDSVGIRAKIRRRLIDEFERAAMGRESETIYAATEPMYSYGYGLSPEDREMEDALADMGG